MRKASLLEVTMLRTSTTELRDINKISKDTNSVSLGTSRITFLNLPLIVHGISSYPISVSSCIMWIKIVSLTRVFVLNKLIHVKHLKQCLEG